ncbi:MAG: DUF6106 family protein [Lachnospiraceae bacterium]|nr:DUF6106 family protein [Lachnospiraceae bacterium]
MNDALYEHIVARKSGPLDLVKKIGIIVALVLLLFILFSIPTVGTFALIIVAGLGFLAYQFVFTKLNVEYEYALLNHDIDIDIIYSQQKRKRLLSFDFQQAEIIAPKNSPRLNAINPEKTYDFTSRAADAKTYAIVISLERKKVCVLIEPDQGMINHMKPWMGSKFFLD